MCIRALEYQFSLFTPFREVNLWNSAIDSLHFLLFFWMGVCIRALERYQFSLSTLHPHYSQKKAILESAITFDVLNRSIHIFLKPWIQRSPVAFGAVSIHFLWFQLLEQSFPSLELI